MGSVPFSIEWNSAQHGYMLGHSHLAASRLNLQFYIWKDTLKFNIHPTIQASLPTDRPIDVADVGCGTCAWLIDSAIERPNDRFTGFDINWEQAPPLIWLPKNAQNLQNLNIFQDVPEQLQGKFDVVHVRLFILVVQNADPRPIIRNLKKMLRPGGWLQWEEVDPKYQYIEWVDPTVEKKREAIDEFIEMKNSQGRNRWISQLSEIMATEGFDQTHQQQFTDPPHILQANSDQQMMTMNEFALTLNTLGRHAEAQKLESLIARVMDELRSQGGAYNQPKVLAMGQSSTQQHTE